MIINPSHNNYETMLIIAMFFSKWEIAGVFAKVHVV
jgi:hypothetical protein